MGGLALDGPTRAAARRLVERDREEFLPDEPLALLERGCRAVADAPVRPGWNVRATGPGPVARAAAVCARHGAVLEVNAHCRQAEMCAAGAGESLAREPDRLRAQVAAAADAGATTSVKLRTEIEGVDLPAVARAAVAAGADAVHVDAMDSEPVVGEVAAAVPDTHLVANNGVRGRATVREYLDHGADAVSVGRPSTDPAALARVRAAVDDLLGTTDGEDGTAARGGERPA
jgi:TIM-barrel protein